MSKKGGRLPKIEQHGCQEIVASGVRAGKSLRAIAKDCTEWAGEPISHTAVERYIETLQAKKEEVVKRDERAVMNIVHQDFDIIQTTLKMANTILRRFEWVDNLPEYFEERMQELEHQLVDSGGDADYLDSWAAGVHHELKRKVLEITALSKETREHMKLMSDLKEKVFRFELMSEYLSLFMSTFQKHGPDAFENAMQEVSSNPRMAQIVEQYRQLSNGKE